MHLEEYKYLIDNRMGRKELGLIFDQKSVIYDACVASNFGRRILISNALRGLRIGCIQWLRLRIGCILGCVLDLLSPGKHTSSVELYMM